MRPSRFAAAVAFAILALPAAAIAAPEPAPDHASVYLGRVTASGEWQEPKFGKLVTIAYAERADEKIASTTIVCLGGATVRKAPSPTAAVLGRLPAGSRVTLLGYHESHGHVWGSIDTAGAKVLTVGGAVDDLPRLAKAHKPKPAPSPSTGLPPSPNPKGVLEEDAIATNARLVDTPGLQRFAARQQLVAVPVARLRC